MPYHIKGKGAFLLDPYIRKRVDEKLVRLNKLRPLPPTAVAKLREQFSLEMTYNSNAIEGNSLTQKETFLVINEGLTVKGKSLKDHLEAKDHHEALEYLYDIVENEKRGTFSEVFIRNLHRLIVKETETESAGVYRSTNVAITGSTHTPPEPHDIPLKMRALVGWVRRNNRRLHPVEFAALLHHKIVFIHPFLDGNGRTARLVMNLFLLRARFPLVVILKYDRKRYYDTLSKADHRYLEPFVRFIAQAIERSLNIYLKTLEPMRATSEQFLPLSVVARKTSYAGKYLNLLARAGHIEAHKEGRRWVTTLKAIQNYRAARQRNR